MFAFVWRHCPRAWGGWSGAPPEAVCSELTRVPATFWTKFPAECHELLTREGRAAFLSSLLMLLSVLFVYVLSLGCCCLWKRKRH